MTKIRKKWMVVWKINIDGFPPETVAGVIEELKKTLGQDVLQAFFETEVMAFFVPVRAIPTQLEVHEIILDEVGYDKYETILHNNNLDVREVLDQLKELLDV